MTPDTPTYVVKTFRNAGLQAKWVKTPAPMIAAAVPGCPYYVVDRYMWGDMQKEGVRPAFERHTLLGDLFSVQV